MPGLRLIGKPRGRRRPTCQKVLNSDSVSDLRKTVGRRIKAARRAAGYKSARGFATAMGLSETSIARAESGSPKVGAGVYLDIESCLGWPTGCIERYLETGNESELPAVNRRQAAESEIEPRDDFERRVLASGASSADKLHYIKRHRAAVEEEQRLLAQLDGNHTNSAAHSNDLGTHS